LKINKIFLLVYVWTISFLLFVNSWAVDPTQDPLKSDILQGIELTINNRFNQAIQIYKSLVEHYPHHPMGYFYVAAAIQAKMLDAENYSEIGEFNGWINRSIHLADSLNKAGNADGWIYFYYGSSFLYRGLMKTKQGSWFSAYRDASKGIKFLEQAIQKDSSIYEAYLGIGSFKYWKSAKTNFLTWLPFIADEREEGLNLIYKSLQKGIFVKWIGRDQLCWILMDKGEYQNALEIASLNCQNYPESRFFRWTLAFATFHTGEWSQSYALYESLLSEAREMKNNNHYNEIDCLVHMAEISAESKEWSNAYDLADQALKLRLDNAIRKRAKNKLKKALEIRNQAFAAVNP
jgi:tetratricopeptide (TPR) repeat protein